jgi:hypothetical protein
MTTTQPDKTSAIDFELYFEKLPSDDVLEARMKAYQSQERRKVKTELRAILLDVLVIVPMARRHLLDHITKRAKK